MAKKSPHYLIVNCINKDEWDLYEYPVYKKAFCFQKYYIETIKEYRDIILRTLKDSDLLILGTVIYKDTHTHNRNNPLFSVG